MKNFISSGFLNSKKLFNRSRNTLNYTLHLPDIVPIAESKERWVSQALIQCHKACHPRLFFLKNYYFFGGSFREADGSSGLYNSLCFYREPSYNSEDEPNFLKEDFFADTILLQCVMSAYDSVIQMLSTPIKPYKIENSCKALGYNWLKANGVSCSIPSAERSSEASNLTSRIIKHMKYSNESLKSVFEIEVKGSYNSAQSDLLYKIANIDARPYKNFMDLYRWDYNNIYKERTLKDHWKIASNFYSYILDNKSTRARKKIYDEPEPVLSISRTTDQLYYLYRVENIFGLELANCIEQNISRLKEAGKPCPDGINNLRSLAQISRLPNAFSRPFYLQFAMDSFWNEDSLQDGFFDKLFDPASLMYTLEKKAFDINKWHILFEKFCRFFGDLIFPVYEWYFFLTLIDTVNAAYPEIYTEEQEEKSSANCTGQTSMGIGREQLLILQEVLSTFIEQHYKEIQNPLSGVIENSGV